MHRICSHWRPWQFVAVKALCRVGIVRWALLPMKLMAADKPRLHVAVVSPVANPPENPLLHDPHHQLLIGTKEIIENLRGKIVKEVTE